MHGSKSFYDKMYTVFYKMKERHLSKSADFFKMPRYPPPDRKKIFFSVFSSCEYAGTAKERSHPTSSAYQNMIYGIADCER